ncbi:MAG: nucleoside hydrolase-like domain-containing protein [Bryobacteraceae bacterium]
MALAAETKPRVIVLSDIENEPDDTQSLVRFLVYSNQWNVEGLVATTSTHLRDRTAAPRIRQLIEAYGKVRENLLRHELGFPEASYLQSVVSEGRPAYGMSAVGPGMDSPGSELIIRTVDRDDPRPVWVLVWGGPNTLAQALWKVRMTRSPEDADRFVARLRVYAISDQDDSGPWIRKNFPALFCIVSPGFGALGAYHHATWSGISGDRLRRFSGPDFSLVDNPWLERNIRSKGPLGAVYPPVQYQMEGDSPTFLYLVANGLSDPERPDWGSWGGRYELYLPRMRKWFLEPETRPIWTDAEDEVQGVDGNWHKSNKATIWRWRSAYQNDFAARMDWTVKPRGEANHPPLARLGHSDRLAARSGEQVRLSASGSSDPDGDPLTFQWIYYPEPGTYSSGRLVEIEGATQPETRLIAPKVTRPETIHIVLAVTDRGQPPLTRYRRVIVTIYP